MAQIPPWGRQVQPEGCTVTERSFGTVAIIFSISRSNIDGLYFLMAYLEGLMNPENWPLVHISVGWGLWPWHPAKAKTQNLRPPKIPNSLKMFLLISWPNANGFKLFLHQFKVHVMPVKIRYFKLNTSTFDRTALWTLDTWCVKQRLFWTASLGCRGTSRPKMLKIYSQKMAKIKRIDVSVLCIQVTPMRSIHVGATWSKLL